MKLKYINTFTELTVASYLYFKTLITFLENLYFLVNDLVIQTHLPPLKYFLLKNKENGKIKEIKW